MGFALLGFSGESLDRDFARPPHHALHESGDESPDPPAPQSFDQLPLGLVRSTVPEYR
jgi:hypothetical protein